MHPDIMFVVQQEQRKDLLKAIEQKRLIRASRRDAPSVWQRARQAIGHGLLKHKIQWPQGQPNLQNCGCQPCC